MSKTVIKLVGGQEFRLKTDNETMLDSVVEEVNAYITDMKKIVPRDTTSEGVAILAGLNIAENHYMAKAKSKEDRDYVCSELGLMSDFLKDLKISKE